MDKKKSKVRRAPVRMKMSPRTEAQIAVAIMRKILHQHRNQGEARLRVLVTIAAEQISKQLGIAMRRELKPDEILLAITRRRLRRALQKQRNSAEPKAGTREKRRKKAASALRHS
jgi:hypothetical protein